MIHRPDGSRRFGVSTMINSYEVTPSAVPIVEAVGASFRPVESRYARSTLMTFGSGAQNAPNLSAQVPTSSRARLFWGLAAVAGALLLLR
jgi:hypothetical protein